MENINKKNLRHYLSENVSSVEEVSEKLIMNGPFKYDRDDLIRLQIINCNYIQRMRELAENLPNSEKKMVDHGLLYDKSIGHTAGLSVIYNNLGALEVEENVLDHILDLINIPFKRNQALGYSKMKRESLEILFPEFKGGFKQFIDHYENEAGPIFRANHKGFSDIERYVIKGCIQEMCEGFGNWSEMPEYFSKQQKQDYTNTSHYIKSGINESIDFLI